MNSNRLSTGAKGASVLGAAWLAIALGLALEALLLLVASGQGADWEPLKSAASAVQRVSWSLVVCVALAWAQVLHPPSALRGGLFGLIGAPVAAITARALHKSALLALGLAPTATGIPWGLIGVRALEYAWLGFWTSRLAGRGPRVHVAAGAVVGTVGVAAQLALQLAGAGLRPGGELVVLAANELLFPVGCSVVLWATNTKARRDAEAAARNG
ncbi:MAG: hypothetical protein HZA53_12465 [Planctomycetes bacterium]|nr:hypothetical protein [Planctomycetota bacterium]